MTEKKKPEIVFMPGCFDNFEGTQEELDEMIAEINRLLETGEFFEQSTLIEFDDLVDEFTEEELEYLSDSIRVTDIKDVTHEYNKKLH